MLIIKIFLRTKFQSHHNAYVKSKNPTQGPKIHLNLRIKSKQVLVGADETNVCYTVYRYMKTNAEQIFIQ